MKLTQEIVTLAGICCDRCGRDGTHAPIEMNDGGDYLCLACDDELFELGAMQDEARWERQQMGFSAL